MKGTQSSSALSPTMHASIRSRSHLKPMSSPSPIPYAHSHTHVFLRTAQPHAAVNLSRSLHERRERVTATSLLVSLFSCVSPGFCRAYGQTHYLNRVTSIPGLLLRSLMIDTLRRAWQAGFEGQHIEELISGVFSDFAPYAGAEHQRLSIVRQYGSRAITSVTVEESGDLICSVGHAAAGSSMFTTAGLLQVDANVKVPLPPQERPSMDSKAQHRQRNAAVECPGGSSATAASMPSSQTPTQQCRRPARFLSTVRGVQLGFGIPAVPRADVGGPRFGQLELETSIPALWQGRVAAGVRAGFAAARISRTPTVIDSGGSSGRSPNTSQNENSGSLGDTVNTETLGDTTNSVHRSAPREAVLYTLDSSVCVPLLGNKAIFGSGGEKNDEDAHQGRSGVNTRRNRPTDVSPELTSDGLGPMALTIGLQHPFSSELPIAGDTLIGLALQNDRNASVAYEADARDDPQRATTGARPRLPREHTFRFLVVQTLMSAQNGSAGGGDMNNANSIGSVDATTLLTNATSRLPNSSGSSRGDATTNTVRGLGSRKPWYSLPTLIGCNVSLKHQLVRLSAASIFHDGEADVEAAAVLDVTQWIPNTPTLLKLGWNSTGRLALGITSLFYDALSLTLGVHAMPGETMRFGLEIKI